MKTQPTPGSQADYYEFMGHDPEVLRRRYAPYARLFAPGGRVLDIGCGRGEFLGLLAGAGCEPVGVDADAAMVAAARADGHEAEQADAVDFLSAHAESLDGVFCAHLVEHLAPASVTALVGAAARALRPGGRLLLVTPNPHSLHMQLYEFWTDLQHVRFYTPEILRWILHEAGFAEVESADNPEYRCGPEVPSADGEEVRVPPTPARQTAPPASLSRRAQLRQQAGEFLQPASTLERIQAVEDDELAGRGRVDALAEEVRRLHQWVGSLRTFLTQLYPPGEYFVTGVRPG